MAREKNRTPPTQSDDRHDKTLPVTGEIGSEGGSYADPTYQVATFGDETEPRTLDEPEVTNFVGETLDFASTRDGSVGTAPDPNAGMIRYPTEPPDPPSATEGWRATPRWRSVAIGAVAGAAASAFVMLLRRRR
jgi:hypothetical protein